MKWNTNTSRNSRVYRLQKTNSRPPCRGKNSSCSNKNSNCSNNAYSLRWTEEGSRENWRGDDWKLGPGWRRKWSVFQMNTVRWGGTPQGGWICKPTVGQKSP